MLRVGVHLIDDHLAEARSLIDPVVAGADYAGKVLAAANASVVLPPDPLVALWQQITVAREWRGDAHLVVLADNGLGPCDCLVLHTATGRLPTALARATRRWDDEEWSAATARLVARGWLDSHGVVTDMRQCGARAHRSGDGPALRRAMGTDRQRRRPPLRLAHLADHPGIYRSRDVSGRARIV